MKTSPRIAISFCTVNVILITFLVALLIGCCGMDYPFPHTAPCNQITYHAHR